MDDEIFNCDKNGNKKAKKSFETVEKTSNVNSNHASASFNEPINTITKTNNKSINQNKSGHMSFMKTIDEAGK